MTPFSLFSHAIAGWRGITAARADQLRASRMLNTRATHYTHHTLHEPHVHLPVVAAACLPPLWPACFMGLSPPNLVALSCPAAAYRACRMASPSLTCCCALSAAPRHGNGGWRRAVSRALLCCAPASICGCASAPHWRRALSLPPPIPGGHSVANSINVTNNGRGRKTRRSWAARTSAKCLGCSAVRRRLLCFHDNTAT